MWGKNPDACQGVGVKVKFNKGVDRYVIRVQNKDHTQKIKNGGKSKIKVGETRNRVKPGNPE